MYGKSSLSGGGCASSPSHMNELDNVGAIALPVVKSEVGARWILARDHLAMVVCACHIGRWAMARTVERVELFAPAWQAAWLVVSSFGASHELRFDDRCTALIFDDEFPLPDCPISEIECGSR